MESSFKRKHQGISPFPALLLAFTILVLMHNFTTPVFEAPDEIWHYNYVRWLAEGHGLPALVNDRSGANQEAAQPPLYYAFAALFSLPFPDDDLQDLFWQNPGFGYQAPRTMPDNKNMLVHTPREHFPWRGTAAAVHFTRFASLLFGLWTLTAAWYLGLEVFKDRKAALISVSLLAFHPQFVFMSSVISNDSATAALCTTALYTMIRTGRIHNSFRDIMLCGLAVGGATLSKTSAVLLIPLGGCVLLFHALHVKSDIKAILKRIVIFGLCILLVGGWWYARNTYLYGDPFGFSRHTATPWGRPAVLSWFQLLPEIPLLVRSFWAAYGWGHIGWVDWIPCSLTIISSLVCAYGLVDLFNKRVYRIKAVLWLSLIWLILVTGALLQWMREVQAPHGRLLFPAIGACSLILANGLTRMRKKGKIWHKITNLYIGVLACLSALAPGVRIVPTFALPRLIPAPVYAETEFSIWYSDLVRMYDVEIPPGYYAPGDILPVKACWEALKPLNVDYTIFIHLIGPDNIRAAERHTYPGLGRYPTTLWQPGTAFCETYQLTIEDWAPFPVLYQLEIGLFNTRDGDRLSATNHQGQPYEPPVAGTVPVYKESNSIPRKLMDISFEDKIQLAGVDIPDSAAPGDTVEVTLYWTAVGVPEPQLTTFVHIWQPGMEVPLAQHDSYPNQGWFPTDVWQQGVHVADIHPIRIPQTLQPGTYPLWTGIYRTASARRLEAIGPEGPITDNLVPIGEIRIE